MTTIPDSYTVYLAQDPAGRTIIKYKKTGEPTFTEVDVSSYVQPNTLSFPVYFAEGTLNGTVFNGSVLSSEDPAFPTKIEAATTFSDLLKEDIIDLSQPASKRFASSYTSVASSTPAAANTGVTGAPGSSTGVTGATSSTATSTATGAAANTGANASTPSQNTTQNQNVVPPSTNPSNSIANTANTPNTPNPNPSQNTTQNQNVVPPSTNPSTNPSNSTANTGTPSQNTTQNQNVVPPATKKTINKNCFNIKTYNGTKETSYQACVLFVLFSFKTEVVDFFFFSDDWDNNNNSFGDDKSKVDFIRKLIKPPPQLDLNYIYDDTNNTNPKHPYWFLLEIFKLLNITDGLTEWKVPMVEVCSPDPVINQVNSNIVSGTVVQNKPDGLVHIGGDPPSGSQNSSRSNSPPVTPRSN